MCFDHISIVKQVNRFVNSTYVTIILRVKYVFGPSSFSENWN